MNKFSILTLALLVTSAASVAHSGAGQLTASPQKTPGPNALITLTTVERSHSVTLVRDDGLWADIGVTCYPYGIETEVSCARSVADYRQIVRIMRTAGFRYNMETWRNRDHAPVRNDIAYQIRTSPNMGGGISYTVYTPHPGLNAQLSNSMNTKDVRQLPANIGRLHQMLKRAANNIRGEDAEHIRILS